MDDESSSLKLKLYIFSSANTDQKQGQKQLPIEGKKKRISTGLPTYASGMTIRINAYDSTIKPAEFKERLGKANKFLEQEYYDEGGKNTLSKSRRKESRRFRNPRNSPSGEHLPEEHLSKDQASRRTLQRRRSGLTEVCNPSSDANSPRIPIRSNNTG